jgi:hypothetical protein
MVLIKNVNAPLSIHIDVRSVGFALPEQPPRFAPFHIFRIPEFAAGLDEAGVHNLFWRQLCVVLIGHILTP